MSRTYSHILKCGCLVAEMDTDGWEGLIPCSAEYYTDDDLKDPEKKEKYLLHERCWKEHNEKYNPNHKILVWKCRSCGDVVVSDSRITHNLDMCRCGRNGIDLEQAMSRQLFIEPDEIEVLFEYEF